jgi:hypothetical protein
MSDPAANVDWEAIPEEQAQRMSYAPQKNDWDKEATDIKVSKAMYASGSRNGCILLRDLDERR